MKKGIVRFAVLGFGGSGRAHVDRLSDFKSVELVIVFDPRFSNAKDLPNKYNGLNLTDHFEEVLNESVDAVAICTPDHTHFQYAKKTIERGIHTLVEKPMFVSKRECDEIELLLRENEIVFGVHHQMRYVPAYQRAKELANQGILGELIAVEADYIHDMRVRASMFDDWRMDPENPQNIVLGGLSHTLDLIRWILDDEVDNILAMGEHKGWKDYPDIDTIFALLHFSHGTIGKVFKTISSYGPQRNTLSIYGTKGQIHNNVLFHRNDSFKIIRYPRFFRLMKRFLINLFVQRAIKSAYFRDYPFSIYEHEIACRSLLADFVNSIQTGCEFSVGFEEGKKTLELCFDCIEAYRNNDY